MCTHSHPHEPVAEATFKHSLHKISRNRNIFLSSRLCSVSCFSETGIEISFSMASCFCVAVSVQRNAYFSLSRDWLQAAAREHRSPLDSSSRDRQTLGLCLTGQWVCHWISLLQQLPWKQICIHYACTHLQTHSHTQTRATGRKRHLTSLLPGSGTGYELRCWRGTKRCLRVIFITGEKTQLPRADVMTKTN